MKKYLFSMLAMATLLFTACSEDDFRGNNGNEVEALFTLELPTEAATRAAGDGTTVDKVKCAIFDENGKELPELTATVDVVGKAATYNVRLIKGRSYRAVFFAYKDATVPYYNVEDLTNIVVNGDQNSNVEERDAFTAYVDVTADESLSAIKKAVALKRPFAQLNLGSVKDDVEAARKAAGFAVGANVLSKSYIKVTGVYNHFNAWSSKTIGETTDFEFKMNTVPAEALKANGEEYTYVALNYILAGEKTTTTVTFNWEDANGKVNDEPAVWSNVPLQRNYRTNILGYVLTNAAEFNITIDADFNETDNNYSVWGGEVVAPAKYDDATKTYTLESAANLAWLAAAVNGTLDTRAAEANSFAGYTFKLACDVDLAGINWSPIGLGGKHFEGNFDGQGFTIKGLKIVERYNGKDQAALFGSIAGTASFKNVVIDGAEIVYPQDGKDFYGAALLGTIYGNITVENVTVVNSKITGNNKVAGLIAHDGLCSSLKIENCHVKDSYIASTDKQDGGCVAGMLGLFQGAQKKDGVAAPYGEHVIANSSVTGCTIVGINSSNSGKRANSEFIGCVISKAGQVLNINNCKIEGNTFSETQDGETAVTYVGFGSKMVGGVRDEAYNGEIFIDGVKLILPEGEKKVAAEDGETYATIEAAVAAGNSEVTLAAGTFVLPAISGIDELTVIGADKNSTFVTVPATRGSDGKVYNFKNITMVRPAGLEYPQGNLQHAKEENYENCIIEGCLRLLVDGTATFNECEFRNTVKGGFDGYAIHYYAETGSKVYVNNCTFNTVSKGICMYNEGAKEFYLEVNNSTFTASEKDDKAAIQMHTEYGITGTLVVNNTTATGFADVNGGLWNEIVNSSNNIYGLPSQTPTNNFVKIIDGVTLVADGVTINAEGAYELSKVAGLKWFRDQVNGGNKFSGKTVLLTEDMDLANELWEPIGLNADDAKKFYGTFDGQGHIISNLKVQREAAYQAAGFFGALNGTAKNFSIVGADIDALSTGAATDNGIAVVAGSIYTKGAIENVTVENATVNGNRYVAGIAGYVYGNIKNCKVSNSEFVATPDDLTGSYDNGDKVGAIAGYFASENTYVLTGNVVENVKVTGYRDMGVVIGAVNGANRVYGNTVNGANYLTIDRTNWYGNKAENAGDVVGRITSGTLGENTVNGAVYYERIMPDYTKNGVEYTVYTAAGLKAMNDMFANKTAGRDAVLILAADIDFTGYTWTTVDSHADTAFEIAEINGNGHTISNLTINGQAMFRRFAGSGDVVVKDITFDNATVNSNGTINTSILTAQTYQNVLLDNVDVKNSTITGGYKVAPLIATVYNESSSTITATLKNCDVENVTVKATSYDFCTTGMVAFVYADDNDKIEFENCTVKNVKLYAPNGYTAHAWIYTEGSETLFNEAEGVTVSGCTFENI